VHLSFASYIALTVSTISRGGVKINISCYMTKLDFWLWSPVEKWFPAPGPWWTMQNACKKSEGRQFQDDRWDKFL